MKGRRYIVKRILTALLLCVLLLCACCAAAEAGYAPLEMEAAIAPKPNAANYLPDNAGYEDETISVSIETTRAYDTTIMIARVKITDPSQIRTAMAGRYGQTGGSFPNVVAKRVNAVFAINGDYFNYRSTGHLVRQGKTYRSRPDTDLDTLIIDENGDFTIIKDPTKEAIAAFEGTIINSFNFGPALIIDGEKVLPVKRMEAGVTNKTQRMAVAQASPLEYVCVATEGPENEGSVGLTIEELIDFMYDLGVKQAYNLDGGSSSAMILNNEKINALSTRKNRPICDMLYFATLIPSEE